MNKDDFEYWENFRKETKRYLENDEYKAICEIYARLNGMPVDYVCKCSPEKIQAMINEINKVFENGK